MMRSYLAVGIVWTGFVVYAPLSVLADASSSPGKVTATASRTDVSLFTDPQNITTSVQLEKGKRKRILFVTVTASTFEYNGAITMGSPFVNSVQIEPQLSNAQPQCESTVGCSITGTYWLDIDAAEAGNPGVFVGKPLQVSQDVFPTRFGPVAQATSITITVVAQMVKK